VSEAVLLAALERAFGPVLRVTRRPAGAASSFALEEVDVLTADLRVERLLLKGQSLSSLTTEGVAAKPARLLDPEREAVAYRDVLVPWGVDVPALHGAGSGDRGWLLLEAVDGIPLWQTEGLASWEGAARWLGELHARGRPPTSPHLLRYDAEYLASWLARATAMTAPGALDAVAAVWPRVVGLLAGWPVALVHGDFYAANILVATAPRAPRIRPVDWELAGVGPGLLDLAALASGAWPEAHRARLADAYAEASGVAGVHEALDHARLFVAVQWLGWSDGWTPPPEQEHDWLADALDLAERIR
jgi:aminoglycoside/choline kinase family phosphotransferase